MGRFFAHRLAISLDMHSDQEVKIIDADTATPASERTSVMHFKSYKGLDEVGIRT